MAHGEFGVKFSSVLYTQVGKTLEKKFKNKKFQILLQNNIYRFHRKSIFYKFLRRFDVFVGLSK